MELAEEVCSGEQVIIVSHHQAPAKARGHVRTIGVHSAQQRAASKLACCPVAWRSALLLSARSLLPPQVVRRIDVAARGVHWSEGGSLVAIAAESSFYLLEYDRDAAEAALGSGQVQLVPLPACQPAAGCCGLISVHPWGGRGSAKRWSRGWVLRCVGAACFVQAGSNLAWTPFFHPLTISLSTGAGRGRRGGGV